VWGRERASESEKERFIVRKTAFYQEVVRGVMGGVDTVR